jgi:hypothetical protein
MRSSPPYIGSGGSSSVEEGVRGVVCPVDLLGSTRFSCFVGVVSGLTLAIYGTHLGRWLLLYLVALCGLSTATSILSTSTSSSTTIFCLALVMEVQGRLRVVGLCFICSHC